MKSVCDMSNLQLTDLSLFDNQLENMECDHIPHTMVTLSLSFNNMKSVCDRTESVNTMTIFFCKSIKLYKYMIRSECLNSINVMSMSF